jgi:hypothetical protein
VWVRRQRLLRSDAEKLAGHAQVDKQNVERIQLDQDVFAAPVYGINPSAA